MFNSSELLDDSFAGSGFSYDDEYLDNISDSDELTESEDDSLTDFEDDDIYAEAFDDDLEEDLASDDDDSTLDNGFNDSFDEL